MHQKLIISTVGISLLTNLLPPHQAEIKNQLYRCTNESNPQPDLCNIVDELQDKALNILLENNAESNRKLSAELNGVYAIFDGQISQAKNSQHVLISTDTWLAKKAAEVLQKFLNSHQIICFTHAPEKLSTIDQASFSHGAKNLLHWCEEFIAPHNNTHYVIFNLTGGFKTLQGYMNIVGMFYANEICYIFESGNTLVRIPKLPIQMDLQLLSQFKMALAMMSKSHLFPKNVIAEIPNSLLDGDQNEMYTLSDWGFLIWNRIKQDVLGGEDLIQFPRLQYENKFVDDYQKARKEERIRLHESLAEVAGILEDHQGDPSHLKSHPGYQYDNYTNITKKAHQPIGHFRVSQGLRVSCTTENGCLILRRFGKEQIVNQNP